MKKIELILVVGIISLLIMAYSFSMIYAHQENVSSRTYEDEEHGHYHGCYMHGEHNEEMEEHHSQMMNQFMEEDNENYIMKYGC